jgi:hypothetical protein
MKIEKKRPEVKKGVMEIGDSKLEKEMKKRIQESLDDIEAGRVHTLEEFKLMNKGWMKEKGWI